MIISEDGKVMIEADAVTCMLDLICIMRSINDAVRDGYIKQEDLNMLFKANSEDIINFTSLFI